MTGGTGALGSDLARWLAARGADHLVLVSRHGSTTPGADVLASELAMLGAKKVTIADCDVADRKALAALLGKLDADGDSVRAVFHVAGDVSLVKPIADTTTADFARVASAKAAGARNLDEILRGPLDAFVLYSSITGVWGGARQSAYSAANAYLDALAERRRAAGLVATSMQWGPWAGPAHDDHLSELGRRGIHVMEPRLALIELDNALGCDDPATVVADVDWSLFGPAYSAARPRRLLCELPEAMAEEAPVHEGTRLYGELRRALMSVAPGRPRRELLMERCRKEVGKVLKLEPERVDVAMPFAAMGFDSLLSLELKKRLEAVVGVALPSTLAWHHPTIEDLAPYLAECMQLRLDAVIETSTPADEIETLSDEDVEALLLERLQAIEGTQHGNSHGGV